ncbi:hypothetical protein NQ314_008630 [Rhamnusium bicolor]|uniref:PiggyBac transposable element-derived protein domain-containing protein n=1 Tax=Rhamnusium bicolor TaxID=1586634 RepID=A0AAV8YA45_9CUCU|nr:hypothetical protein NQ314_008630 [Rhamnusium bicolor]
MDKRVPPLSSKRKRKIVPPLTGHNETPAQKRRRTDESKTPKLKPAAIIAYNNGKCGIDKSDQMASNSTYSRRGVKWYRKVVFELLTGMSMVNAFIIHKIHTNSKSNINTFREYRHLLFGRNYCKKNMVGPKEKFVHLLKKTEEKTRKQCILCYKKLTKEMSRAEARKKVKKVRKYREGCDGKPIMCMDCHIEHHS